MSTLKGRRVTAPKGKSPYSVLENPGDYCGPIFGYSGNNPAVFFIIPIIGTIKFEGIHHVQSPPHRFVEESDGSLSIFNSIECNPSKDPTQQYWHGHLKSGIWGEC